MLPSLRGRVVSRPARFLTHAARARRRIAIRRALLDKTTYEVAAEFGLTRSYICMIAREAGIVKALGRPRGTRWWADCPDHLTADYDYLSRRKRIPVAEIKTILEAA